MSAQTTRQSRSKAIHYAHCLGLLLLFVLVALQNSSLEDHGPQHEAKIVKKLSDTEGRVLLELRDVQPDDTVWQVLAQPDADGHTLTVVGQIDLNKDDVDRGKDGTVKFYQNVRLVLDPDQEVIDYRFIVANPSTTTKIKSLGVQFADGDLKDVPGGAYSWTSLCMHNL